MPIISIPDCWAATLDALHARIAPRFRRAEARSVCAAISMPCVLPSRARTAGNSPNISARRGRKASSACSMPPTGTPRPCATTSVAFVAEQLGDPDGVLIVDETGFLKKGTKSVGVQRQYSGTAGRRENQQIGVFLAYASPRGTAFLDRALYLPEVWAADADRRAEAGVPETVAFATKGELAKGMLARAFAAQVPGGMGRRRHDLRRGRPAALAGEAGAPVCARRALHARALDRGSAGGGTGAGRRGARSGLGATIGGGREPRAALVRLGTAGAAVRRPAGDGALAARPSWDRRPE